MAVDRDVGEVSSTRVGQSGPKEVARVGALQGRVMRGETGQQQGALPILREFSRTGEVLDAIAH